MSSLDPVGPHIDPKLSNEGSIFVRIPCLAAPDGDEADLAVHPRFNLDAEVFYTYDGCAYGVQFWDFPADLTNIPFAREAAQALSARGVPVVDSSVASPHHAVLHTAQFPHPLISGAPIMSSSGKPPSRTISFVYREGRPYYRNDVVGDGTNVVEHSYEGQALRFVVTRPDWPVVLDSVPLNREIKSQLLASSIPVANLDDPFNRRPVLTELTDIGPSTHLVVHYCFAYGRGRTCRLPGGTLVYTTTGEPLWIELRARRGVVDLREAPEEERLAAIVRHQGLAVAN